MTLKHTLFYWLVCLASGSLSVFCQAQSCLPPSNIQTSLQPNVHNDSGNVVDSLFIQWLPVSDAAGYHCRVQLDGQLVWDNQTADSQFACAFQTTSWDVAEIQMQTICEDGSTSDWKAESIIATVDEVYKIYQMGNCNDLNMCSECICNAIETLLEDSTAINQFIEDSDYLGNYGCAGFLNRFLEFNTDSLIALCPCYMPQQDCYNTYPCNGFNCSTGLREPSNMTYDWRLRNNADNEQVIVEYAVFQPIASTLRIYDQMGVCIETIKTPEKKLVGWHQIEVSLPHMGVYIFELQVGNNRDNKKLVFLR